MGLSGGIDSALVATMSVDALGFQNVEAYLMASNFTSKTSSEVDFIFLKKELSIILITN